MNILLLAALAFFSLFSEGFSPDALVLVPYGKKSRHVRIDTLKPGEYVLSENEHGKAVPNRILAVRKQKISSYEKIKFSKGELKTALNQKFKCDCKKEWFEILRSCSAYPKLICKDNKLIELLHGEFIYKEEEFIDLAFAKHHNFYVTENNILTHNFQHQILLFSKLQIRQ